MPPLPETLEDRKLFSILTVTSLQDGGAGSLRAEIAAAQSGDTIVFASTLSGSPTLSGTATLASAPVKSNSSKHGHGKPTPTPPPPPPPPPPPTITLTTGELLLDKNLTIQGPGAGQLDVVGSGSRAFEVAQGSTVALSGLAIGGSTSYWTGTGTSPGSGGAILNHGGLAMTGCTVSGAVVSSLGRGGGIFNDGTLYVTGCTVSGCLAEGSAGGDENAEGASGAGIANSGTATLTNTIISNNKATETTSYPWFNQGGGIFNTGTMTLTGCTVSDNYSQNEAGGIFNAGTLTLGSTTLSGNLAPGGGGGISNFGTVTVKNSSSITGNFVGGNAAGDVNNLGVLYLESNTSTIGVLTGNPAVLI